MTSPVSRKNCLTATSTAQNRPRGKPSKITTIACTKLQPQAVSREKVLMPKLDVKNLFKETIEKLDKKYNRSFTPFLTSLSSYGFLLNSRPLLSSILYSIQLDLNEAIATHEIFFSKHPHLFEKFNLYILQNISSDISALENKIKANEICKITLGSLQATLDCLNEIKEKILSETKQSPAVTRHRLASIKTKSLNKASDSLSLLLSIAKCEKERKILIHPLKNIIKFPFISREILAEIPRMVDNLLLQIKNETFLEECYFKALKSTGNQVESKQIIINTLISNFRADHHQNLSSVHKLQVALIELKEHEERYKNVTGPKNTLRTFEDLVQLSLAWEKCYIYWNTPSLLQKIRNLESILSSASSSLSNFQPKKGLENLKDIPNCQELYNSIKEQLDVLTQNEKENLLLDLKQKLTNFLENPENPVLFFELWESVDQFREKLILALYIWDSNFEKISKFFFANLPHIECLTELTKIGESFRLLSDWLSNDLKVSTELLVQWFNSFQENKPELVSQDISNSSKKRKKKKKKSQLTRGTSQTPEMSIAKAKKVSALNKVQKKKTKGLLDQASKQELSSIPALSDDLISETKDVLDSKYDASKNVRSEFAQISSEQELNPVPDLSAAMITKSKQTSLKRKKTSSKMVSDSNNVSQKKKKSNLKKTSKQVSNTNQEFLEQDSQMILRNLKLDLLSEKNRKSRNITRMFAKYGWNLVRQKGGHQIFQQNGIQGSLTVPNHNILKMGTASAIVEAMVSLQNKAKQNSKIENL